MLSYNKYGSHKCTEYIHEIILQVEKFIYLACDKTKILFCNFFFLIFRICVIFIIALSIKCAYIVFTLIFFQNLSFLQIYYYIPYFVLSLFIYY